MVSGLLRPPGARGLLALLLLLLLLPPPPPVQGARVQCRKPEVQNGRMVNALHEKTWFNVNETIPFKCSPEYQFSSHSDLPATDRFSITCLADGSWTALPVCKKQSASDVCEILKCDVPLAEMKTLLELEKINLEIEKLKQELKLQSIAETCDEYCDKSVS